MATTQLRARFDGTTQKASFAENRPLIGFSFRFNMKLASTMTFPAVFGAGHPVLHLDKVSMKITCGEDGKIQHFSGKLSEYLISLSRNTSHYDAFRYMDNPKYNSSAINQGFICGEVYLPFGTSIMATSRMPVVVSLTPQSSACAGSVAATSTVTLGATTITYVTGVTSGAPMVDANNNSTYIEVKPIYGSAQTPVSVFSPVLNIYNVDTNETVVQLPSYDNVYRVNYVDTTKPRILSVNPNISGLPTVTPLEEVSITSMGYDETLTRPEILSRSEYPLDTYEETISHHGDYVIFNHGPSAVELDAAKIQISLASAPGGSNAHFVSILEMRQFFVDQAGYSIETQERRLQTIQGKINGR